ncbi:GTPase [Xylariaceae sp. FL0804]|nr:GTPase [Xylariaceae sp. FL0804]
MPDYAPPESVDRQRPARPPSGPPRGIASQRHRWSVLPTTSAAAAAAAAACSPLWNALPPMAAAERRNPCLPFMTHPSHSRDSTPHHLPLEFESARGPSARAKNTIRTVTPEPVENGRDSPQPQPQPQPQTSPRVIPGGEFRRQGIVFDNAFSEPFDPPSSSPPRQQRAAALRPRTHTVDGALAVRQQAAAHQAAAAAPPEHRHRVGSLSYSSSNSHPQPFSEVDVRTPPTVLESAAYPSVATSRAQAQDPRLAAPPNKERKPGNRRLIKRGSSRPTSPLISPPPSVDSLALPIPTNDANRILLLMKTLCGRMKGEVEYQAEPGGPWHSAVCYIDEERGSLMVDGGHAGHAGHAGHGAGGSSGGPVVADLRGCRVLPVVLAEDGARCLELYGQKMTQELLLRPLAPEEVDLWLASLLCWQQLRPSGVRIPSMGSRGSNSPGPGTGTVTVRPDARRRGSSATGSSSRDSTIIKVGKVMLWDKGVATSPRAIVKRPSTRDLRSVSTSWRRVSCMLQDNGEFKLMTENDVSVLSVIELTQLSRCAVQQLDKSVLDEEYCIAIFPMYSATSRQLSIFRPVFLALDSRVLFEVWFVLLRAFAVPDMYGLAASSGQVVDVTDLEAEFDGQLFRMEKYIQVRVVEAKLRRATSAPEHQHPHQHQHGHHGGHGGHGGHGRDRDRDRDPLAGNYLAEVILDGEVRARTTTQTDTRNPFWREHAQFTDLPATLPYLSVILKRVDGNLESVSHQLQASLGLPKTGNLTEISCGSVDIPLDKMERARDHEQWFQVCDERQESIGSMFVKVNHDELVVLTARDYKPLSELLHNFSVALTGQIAQALPGQMRRLSEIFLNIFQVSGSAAYWLMALVEDEIDGIGSQNTSKKMRFSRRLKSNESSTSASDREQLVRDMGKSLAGEANLLFRGNTLLTQSLEFHMRRLGKEYLEDVLAEKIFEINELNPDCEVDPSRIERPEDLHQHWTQLMQLTTDVWECIAVTATRLPPELRHVLKYVRAVAEDRYGDFLRTVNYTSVSGFLFLRFICPAVLNPKLFGLLRDNPRPRAQRTLTLVAKGLQALANLSTFGKKESWMEPMNRFLTSQRQSFKDYIDQLCSIPSERSERELSVPSASYSTPVAILGRLPPLSKEGCPSLPYLVDHQRSFAALAKLWLESSNHATGAANNPSQPLEGELAEFHGHCVDLQRRADDCLAGMEQVRAAEAESMAAENDLAESLEKAALLDQQGLGLGLHGHASPPPSWMDSDPYRAPGSSGSEQDGGDRSLSGHSARHGGGGSSSHRHHHLASLRPKGKSSRDPRAFLSGLIGGSKRGNNNNNSSKDGSGSASASTVRDKSRDKERDNKDGGNSNNSRSLLGSFSESWQSDNTSSSRH